MNNKYDEGRLNLPFVGICTFGKYPYFEDWKNINADVAVMGAPFDTGAQFRSGARMGPRGIREASTLFSFGHAGAYDHEDDIVYLPSETTKIIDIGDADIIHTDTLKSHSNIKYGVKKILEAKNNKKILIQKPKKGEKIKHIKLAEKNAKENIKLKKASLEIHRKVAGVLSCIVIRFWCRNIIFKSAWNSLPLAMKNT